LEISFTAQLELFLNIKEHELAVL